MKPRTKFQQSVVAASKHLPPLTPAQIEWGYKNCIEHIGRRTPKGLITCTECGHTWQSENGELTDNLLGCECPHCHTTLKVETTLRRKFNDYEYLCIVTRCKGFQVLRFVYIECWAKVGQTPVYTHIEAVQRWIAPDGRSATFARLRPMGFFVHGWSWSSALELRAENDGKYNITPTRIYPRQRLIPELRRSGYGKQLPDVTPFDLIHLLLSENKAETLLKAGQTALVRFFARSSRNIADYWPAIRIAIRNGYAIGKPTEWCDYIDLLRFSGKTCITPISCVPQTCPQRMTSTWQKNGGTCKWNGGRRNGARRWNRKPRLSKPKGGFSEWSFPTGKSASRYWTALKPYGRRVRPCTIACLPTNTI